MEVLVFTLVVAVLGLAALRFGHDSRSSAYSKEEESAAFGVTPQAITSPARRRLR